MWGSDIKKWAEGIKKWLDANWFKIKLFVFLFIVGSGCFLALKVVEVISGIESNTGKIIAGVFVGLGTLAITYFISYFHGSRNASLKKDDEIKRYKKAVCSQEDLASQVVKLQGEAEQKNRAYSQLRNEIKKIKSDEDREALEKRWDEIRETYGMTVEKIQETASPLAEVATQRMKVLVEGTQGLLEKGVSEAKKGIFKVFRKKEKDKGGEPD